MIIVQQDFNLENTVLDLEGLDLNPSFIAHIHSDAAVETCLGIIPWVCAFSFLISRDEIVITTPA